MYLHIYMYIIGIKATSMNVHMLQHLPNCVQQWGPLWAYSCFHFENMNGTLKSQFHGIRNMTKQVYGNFNCKVTYCTYCSILVDGFLVCGYARTSPDTPTLPVFHECCEHICQHSVWWKEVYKFLVAFA